MVKENNTMYKLKNVNDKTLYVGHKIKKIEN